MSYLEMPFQGQSMNPLFKGASHVLVEPMSATPPQVGEIFLYRDERGEWVCHRLIAVEEGEFVLKGDWNTTAERRRGFQPWGRVRGFVRGARSFYLAPLALSQWLCWSQKGQLQKNRFRKIYRLMSWLILLFEKRRANLAPNHRAS